MTPIVSVIIPCHNYAHLLGETLESVRAQTLPEWECLVVDDGSSDGTAELVASFRARDERFVLVERENAGVSAARNAGIARARGEFLQFLDADDLIEADKLRVHSDLLRGNPEWALVYGDARFFDSSDAPWPPESRLRLGMLPDSPERMPRVSSEQTDVMAPLLRQNIMVVSAPLVRRDWVRRAGGFVAGFNHNEDWDLWLRLAVLGAQFQYSDAPQTRTLIRVHGHSASQNRAEMFRGEWEMRARWREILLHPSHRAFNEERILRAKGLWLQIQSKGRHFGRGRALLRAEPKANRAPILKYCLAAQLFEWPLFGRLWRKLKK